MSEIETPKSKVECEMFRFASRAEAKVHKRMIATKAHAEKLDKAGVGEKCQMAIDLKNAKQLVAFTAYDIKRFEKLCADCETKVGAAVTDEDKAQAEPALKYHKDVLEKLQKDNAAGKAEVARLEKAITDYCATAE